LSPPQKIAGNSNDDPDQQKALSVFVDRHRVQTLTLAGERNDTILSTVSRLTVNVPSRRPTTMWRFAAIRFLVRRTKRMSPSRIPASIIESPLEVLIKKNDCR
jgi:hypothetical protein